MKILFVTGRFPFPPHKGDQVVTYNRLKELTRRHEVTLLSFYDSETDLEDINKISSIVTELRLVPYSRWRAFLQMLLAPFSKLPLQVLLYRSGKMDKALQSLVTSRDFDVVHTVTLRMAEYTKHLRQLGIKSVIELIDSMELNLVRRYEQERPLLKPIVKLELSRIRLYEGSVSMMYHRASVVSRVDLQAIKSPNIAVVPLGVDTETFNPAAGIDKTVDIIFTGNMGYFPNVNAIRWFIENCLSLVRSEYPDVMLMIAGKNAEKTLEKFASDRVKVVGFVPSLAAAISSSRIAIAPMRSGSGMQFKILEAMACNVPVVATSLGLGSIEATDGHEILVGNTAKEFADQCVSLLRNSSQREKIGNSGLKLVREKYSWKKSAQIFEEIYKS